MSKDFGFGADKVGLDDLQLGKKKWLNLIIGLVEILIGCSICEYAQDWTSIKLCRLRDQLNYVPVIYRCFAAKESTLSNCCRGGVFWRCQSEKEIKDRLFQERSDI